MDGALPEVDSVLIVAFGGPEGPADVVPFLRQVTAGRDVAPGRLDEVAGHYLSAFGGVSPINGQTRSLARALRDLLRDSRPELPVYWGNRNWYPFLAQTVAGMVRDGRRHALSLTTSPYPSYSSCRQYDEDVAAARAAVPGSPVVTRLRHYDEEDGFLRAQAAAVAAAVGRVGPQARLVFTAHSLPQSMADAAGPRGGGYVAALRRAAEGVLARLTSAHDWDLVFQSRSGPPAVPWLGPDVGDHLEELYRRGVRQVVLVPIGFISDHVEVLYDLDIEATRRAAGLSGLVLARAATVGVAPSFVAALRDLIAERVAAPGTWPTPVCPRGCCPVPVSRRPPPPRPHD